MKYDSILLVKKIISQSEQQTHTISLYLNVANNSMLCNVLERMLDGKYVVILFLKVKYKMLYALNHSTNMPA
jgi:hypothetical protein